MKRNYLYLLSVLILISAYYSSAQDSGKVLVASSGSESKKLPQPDQTELLWNYPNPFNPSTTIRYTVKTSNNSAVEVNLSIYNLLGQKVTTLISDKLSPGDYQITWNASDYPGGVYFCHFNVDNEYEEIRKLMLVK